MVGLKLELRNKKINNSKISKKKVKNKKWKCPPFFFFFFLLVSFFLFRPLPHVFSSCYLSWFKLLLCCLLQSNNPILLHSYSLIVLLYIFHIFSFCFEKLGWQKPCYIKPRWRKVNSNMYFFWRRNGNFWKMEMKSKIKSQKRIYS